jgi:hypothetical protein
MCIIMYFPTGKNAKKETLATAFKNNPDGGGVMYYKGDSVMYQKGFMDFDTFYKFWETLPTNTPRAVHFRIATSGKVSAGCCHPFPICDNLEQMLEPVGTPEKGCLMHNGIFSEYTPKDGLLSPYSDTMFYNKDLIYPILPVIDNTSVIKLLGQMTSRVLLFLPDEVLRFGDWVQDKEQGFFASNSTYENYVYTYPTTYYDGYYANGVHYGAGSGGYKVGGKVSSGQSSLDDYDEFSDSKPKTKNPKFTKPSYWYYLVVYSTHNEGRKRIFQILKRLNAYIVDRTYTYKSMQYLGYGQWAFAICTTQRIDALLPDDVDVFEQDTYNNVFDECGKVRTKKSKAIVKVKSL